MIKINTVFILGAGASRPFEFPTGPELVERVIKSLQESGIGRADKPSAFDHLHDLGIEVDEIRRFQRHLRLSGAMSVDVFLEHRREFLEIGKAAIAANLIPFEKSILLFPENVDGGKELKGPGSILSRQ